MKKLIEGNQRFLSSMSADRKALLASFANGQQPPTLMITCSDSRVCPEIFTQCEPGDLFVIRNAGNIVPKHKLGSQGSGELGTIEYAVKALKVQHIIVCGHTKCGAMTGLLDVEGLASLPDVKNWVCEAQHSLDAVHAKCSVDDLDQDTKVQTMVEQNVASQLDRLRAIDYVKAAIDSGSLALHGWVYNIETGGIDCYNPDKSAFESLETCTSSAC